MPTKTKDPILLPSTKYTRVGLSAGDLSRRSLSYTVPMVVIIVWLLTGTFLIVQIRSPVLTEPVSPPWNLPNWGILVTTTKTILVPEGVVLSTLDPTRDKTFRLYRRPPKGPSDDGHL